MWSKLKTWYDDWNNELLNVMLHPEQARNITIPWRKKLAQKMAELSAIERQQLHQFCITYTGMRLWLSLLKFAILFSLAGVALHLALPKIEWLPALFLANTFGYSVLLGLIGVWFNYRKIYQKKWRYGLKIFLSAPIGALIGMSLGSWLKGRPFSEILLDKAPIAIFVTAGFALLYLLLIGLVAAWRNQAYVTRTVELELEAERERAARADSEAQLRLLRAQIEPHFLFNTLGAVQQLAEVGAPKAAALCANLIAFLRANMHEIGAQEISLAQEFKMLRAYLEIMHTRLGSRLSFSLDCAPELMQQPIPSMLLLTLAENAIKHGIEPAIAGGRIEITAHQVGTQLCLRILDTGVGLSEQPGQGHGLHNIRERLQLRYGASAALNLNESETGGVCAEIRLPINQ